jgi:hypothetical protein
MHDKDDENLLAETIPAYVHRDKNSTLFSTTT